MLELKQDRRAERLLSAGKRREGKGEGTRYVQWISGFLAYWVLYILWVLHSEPNKSTQTNFVPGVIWSFYPMRSVCNVLRGPLSAVSGSSKPPQGT